MKKHLSLCITGVCTILLLSACSSTGKASYFSDGQLKGQAINKALFFFADSNNLVERQNFESHFVRKSKKNSVQACSKVLSNSFTPKADQLTEWAMANQMDAIIIASVPQSIRESSGSLAGDMENGLISVNTEIRNNGNVTFLVYEPSGAFRSKSLVILQKGSYKNVVPAAIDKFIAELNRK